MIRRTSLDDGDGDVGVSGESVGEDAAGCAASDDYVVVRCEGGEGIHSSLREWRAEEEAEERSRRGEEGATCPRRRKRRKIERS